MEDPKITDKRKAPDKTDTMSLLNDSDSSLIEQKPLKRPRIEIESSPAVEEDVLQGNISTANNTVPSLQMNSDIQVLSLDKSDGDNEEEEESVGSGNGIEVSF